MRHGRLFPMYHPKKYCGKHEISMGIQMHVFKLSKFQGKHPNLLINCFSATLYPLKLTCRKV
jgi:hypothetical protein